MFFHTEVLFLNANAQIFNVFTMSDRKQDKSLNPDPSKIDQIDEDQADSHDAVFGEITGEGPNYRNVRCSSLQSFRTRFAN